VPQQPDSNHSILTNDQDASLMHNTKLLYVIISPLSRNVLFETSTSFLPSLFESVCNDVSDLRSLALKIFYRDWLILLLTRLLYSLSLPS